MGNMMGIDLAGVFLGILTLYFVKKDRAFSKKIRIEYHAAGMICLITNLYCNFRYVVKSLWGNGIQNNSGLQIVEICEYVSCLIAVVLVAHIFVQLNKSKQDKYFVAFMAVILGAAIVRQVNERESGRLISMSCILLSVFCYYFAVQAYKKDNLTKLLLRHDLNFDMERLNGKLYNIVLIDVDNFKLINDKYGHDKGDEVLVTIANIVKEHLPKDCNLYRYGGDEFVVISTKTESEELENVFDKINEELGKNELRISHGIVTHNPEDSGDMCLTEADKRMYENKKLLKSEDIWDDMTGLFNYRGFIDEIEAFRKTVNKDKHSVCLIAMDIDRLNSINMAYGYTEGNYAITALARVLKSCLKGRDFIGHLGSDEFGVALECTGEDDERIISFIDEMTEGIGSAYEFVNKDYSLKINLGRYYVDDSDEATAEELVNNVLYVKQTDKEDRRKTGLADDDQEYDNQEEELVTDILDNNRFKYAFQPIVSAKNGDIVAYETLMRSDTETMISPLKILKYAERSKRLYDIEKYTFFNVLAKISEENCIADNRRIFINSIPGYMLNDVDYDLLKNKYSALFGKIVTEITEMREVDDEALATLNSRRDRDGFNLAIDDYGSGFSNTNSLLRYMPQVIKLDRLLITGIDRNAKKQFFVNSIISFARENDMQILAEGVETESELKTVIRLGVDLIQGFYTAKPAFEILDEIPNEIKKVIVDENLKVTGNQRMVYTASSNGDLSVMHLAMEDYSKVNISAEYVKLMGSPEYTADMVVRIKDGIDCKLILSDVCLNSVDDEPCIDVGENTNLTLYLEGNSKLNAKGIHVPESSTLTVKGSGNLEIYAKGHQCYAIGADSESDFGKLTFMNSGTITASVDGEMCVGIGGGIARGNSEISILGGVYAINVAGIEAVGIGCYEGLVKVYVKDSVTKVDFRVNKGIVLGSFGQEIDVRIQNFFVEIIGSGTEVCGIGSVGTASGNIIMDSGTYKIKLNGQRLHLVGCREGQLNIEVIHVKVEMTGEGDSVLGFGSDDMNSHLRSDASTLQLVINASSPIGFGTIEESVGFIGHVSVARINGEEVVMGRAQ